MRLRAATFRLILLAALIGSAACGRQADRPFDNARSPLPSASAPVRGDRVSFVSDERALDLLSPDGRYRLVSTTADGSIQLLVRPSREEDSPLAVGTYEPPIGVLWSPGSDRFFVNHQRGSGQSSYLEVVRLEQGRFLRDTRAHAAIARLYNRLFECGLDPAWIYSSGQAWLDVSTVIVEVEVSHRAEGCPLDPLSANKLVLLVDSSTGEVELRRLPRP